MAALCYWNLRMACLLALSVSFRQSRISKKKQSGKGAFAMRMCATTYQDQGIACGVLRCAVAENGGEP